MGKYDDMGGSGTEGGLRASQAIRDLEQRAEKAEAERDFLKVKCLGAVDWAARNQRELIQRTWGGNAPEIVQGIIDQMLSVHDERDELREWKTKALRWMSAIERNSGETHTMALARVVQRLPELVKAEAEHDELRAEVEQLRVKTDGDKARKAMAKLVRCEAEHRDRAEAEVERLRGLDPSLPGYAECIQAMNSLITDENGKILIRSMRHTGECLHEERAELVAARERIAELEAAIVKTWHSMDEAPPPFFTTQEMRNSIVGACKVANVRPWEASNE